MGTFVSEEVKYFTFINTTGAKTGKWYKIVVIAAATFTTLTAGNSVSSDTMTGVAIPAGTILLGDFTAITLTSGTVIAYAR